MRSQVEDQAQLYLEQQDEDRRVEREAQGGAGEMKAKKAAAKEALKAARDAEKAIQLSQKGKRKALGTELYSKAEALAHHPSGHGTRQFLVNPWLLYATLQFEISLS
ncbi:hypothetical protein J1614_003861 [Plenodomus biglobosus]|nr:hypothetical protein J1614_003861 [Plenodomus biglobosus]